MKPNLALGMVLKAHGGVDSEPVQKPVIRHASTNWTIWIINIFPVLFTMPRLSCLLHLWQVESDINCVKIP